MKSQALHTVWCYIISGEAAGGICHWSLLGVKGLNYLMKVIENTIMNILSKQKPEEIGHGIWNYCYAQYAVSSHNNA